MTDNGTDGDRTDSYYESDPETGRIVEQYSGQDFLDAVTALDGASTGDVADHLGCSPRRARDRLKKLAKLGRIQQIDTKGGYVWLPNDDSEKSE